MNPKRKFNALYERIKKTNEYWEVDIDSESKRQIICHVETLFAKFTIIVKWTGAMWYWNPRLGYIYKSHSTKKVIKFLKSRSLLLLENNERISQDQNKNP